MVSQGPETIRVEMLENCNQITKWPCLVVNLSPSNQSYHIILGLSWQNEKIQREMRDPVELFNFGNTIFVLKAEAYFSDNLALKRRNLRFAERLAPSLQP